MDQSNSKSYITPENYYFWRVQSYFDRSGSTFSGEAYGFPQFAPHQSLIGARVMLSRSFRWMMSNLVAARAASTSTKHDDGN